MTIRLLPLLLFAAALLAPPTLAEDKPKVPGHDYAVGMWPTWNRVESPISAL